MIITGLAAIILSGVVVAIIVLRVLEWLQKLRFEKRLKTRKTELDGRARDATGEILFIAEKIGKRLQNINRLHFLRTIANDTTVKLAIMGEPYDKVAAHTVLGAGIIAGFFTALIAAAIANVYNPLFLIVIAAGAAALPYLFLKEKVDAKHRAIFRQIPDLLDLLTLMIEAGLDFTAALSRVIATEKGPLMSEFARAQQQIHLGKPRSEAFTAIAERVRYLPLTTVINALTLSLKTGGSIAPTLRALAEQFRTERFQLAEKTASEAPLKLMVPLVLLIFPTIFIILFGPIFLSFIYNKGF